MESKRRTTVQRMLDSINDLRPNEREEIAEALLDAQIDEIPLKEIEGEPISLLDEWEEIENHDANFGKLVGLSTGYRVLDDMTMGLAPGELTIVAAPTSVGKGEPLDNLLPTPNGFVRMGDIKVGDFVFNNNGKPTRVKGVFDKGVKQTYEVRFDDGCSIEVCEDHLWTVHTPASAGHRHYIKVQTLDTKTLYAISLDREKEKTFFGGRKNDIFRCYLPEQEAVEYSEKPLPIHPYVLGGLLADGYLRNTSLQWTKKDDSVIAKMNAIEPLVHRANPVQHGFKNSKKIMAELRKMGLWGKSSADKFIPEQYLLASVTQRKALLEGLLDGDGTTQDGITVYSTTSERLKNDVIELASSLGIITRASLVQDSQRGKKHDYWRIRLHLKNRSCSNLIKNRCYGQTHRKMVSIVPKRKTEIRCIAVEAKNELYLTSRNYIVTHNSLLCLNIAANLVMKDHAVGFITLEMTRPEIGSRLKRILGDENASLVGGVIVNKSDRMSWRSVETFLKKAKENWNIEALFIDHLHYFARNLENQAEELGLITQEFKHLAIKYNIPIVLISHTRKTDNMGKERAATMNDLRGSSFIAQDADIVLMLNRVWQNDEDSGTIVDPTGIRVTLEKNRNRYGVPVGTAFRLNKNGLRIETAMSSEELMAWNRNKPEQKQGFSSQYQAQPQPTPPKESPIEQDIFSDLI